MEFILLIGLITWPVAYMLMPIRSLWIMYRYFVPSNYVVFEKKYFFTSNLLLCLAILLLVTGSVYIYSSGPGTSGFFVAFLSAPVAVLYITAEFLRLKSASSKKIKYKEDEDLLSEIDSQLFDAVIANELDLVEKLVAQGANINIKNDLGVTPIDYARGRNHKEILAYFTKAE